MSLDARSNKDSKDLHAAFEKSAALGAWILNSCVAENEEYFKSNPALYQKINERRLRGLELAEAGNHRTATIIQRHAIDLILQEDHQVFKQSSALRAALLRYRDHDVKVIAPLWERQKDNI